MLWPLLETMEKQSEGKWTVVKVDIDLEELSEAVNAHSVSGVPTLAFYKGEKKLHQQSGYVDKAALKKLEEKYLL
jgi:thioredoxin-like negative regulator of GroEL